MKRISTVILSFAALMMLMLASCSKQQGAANLVPDDAVFVMRMDVLQGMEKSGLKGDKSEMKKWIEEQVKEAGLDKELTDKILQIVDDPTKSGIDFTEPVFIYASTDFGKKVDAGFVAAMASESDLTNLFKTLEEDVDFPGVEKKDGVNYLELGTDAAIIYCDDWFYGGPAKDVDEQIATLKERAGGKGSLGGNKAFNAMCSKNGVAQMLFLGSGFENIKDREMKMMKLMMEKMFPEGVELKDMAGLLDFQLNKGETVLTSEYLMLSSKAQDYLDESLKALKPITKEQVKYISDRALSLFVNMDVSKVLEQIDKMKDLYDLDDESMNLVKKVFETLDGSLALDVYGIGDNMPLLTAYVGTKDNTALSMVKQAGDDDLKAVADDEYLVPTDFDYEWDEDDNFVRTPKAWGVLGYKDGLTYFSSEAENAFQAPATEYPFGNVKGCGFFARFNFSIFKDYLKNVEDDDEARQVLQAVDDIFDYAEAYAEKDGKAIFRVVTKDKDKTIIETISDYVQKYLH